jgi:hypothetical protein
MAKSQSRPVGSDKAATSTNSKVRAKSPSGVAGFLDEADKLGALLIEYTEKLKTIQRTIEEGSGKPSTLQFVNELKLGERLIPPSENLARQVSYLMESGKLTLAGIAELRLRLVEFEHYLFCVQDFLAARPGQSASR